MPSSGKTTVGKIVAQKTGRDLIDLDDEIVSKIGCEIAEFFKSHTENEFRNEETSITKAISKRNGIVIATGGGCILRSENVNALRQNGRLYFLNRSLASLTPTDSRPLSSKMRDLEELYYKRYPIYSSVCDRQIDGDLTPEKEADLIREEYFNR
jgi:shikimate dehydrogenase